ncbi:MAG: ACT domain-containing protein [Treponema sp.]|jgi:L-serine dehydratase|nr:ACT domain-containing protein [Treponema sp.]
MPKENVPLFEIFGPVMIGPSSSHTAGVARIAFLARKMFGVPPERALVRFYGSLASTWEGHGSADAVAAGLLGIPPEDERLFRGREFLEELRKEGKGFALRIVPVNGLPPSWHPNTLVIELSGPLPAASPGPASPGPVSPAAAPGPASPGPVSPATGGERGREARLTIRGSSIGGGSIRVDEIDGYGVRLSGELEAILVLHHDEIGVIAQVSRILASARINIAGTSSIRKEKGEEALLVVETDSPVPPGVLAQIETLSAIYRVMRLPSLEGCPQKEDCPPSESCPPAEGL